MTKDQSEKQYLFDKAFRHVIQQGRPSVKLDLAAKDGPMYYCVYKSEDGCGCAAAPFIINYKPEMEKNRFRIVAENFPFDVDPVAIAHADFVMELQQAHDDNSKIPGPEFTRVYTHIMHKIARQHRLEMPA